MHITVSGGLVQVEHLRFRRIRVKVCQTIEHFLTNRKRILVKNICLFFNWESKEPLVQYFYTKDSFARFLSSIFAIRVNYIFVLRKDSKISFILITVSLVAAYIVWLTCGRICHFCRFWSLAKFPLELIEKLTFFNF